MKVDYIRLVIVLVCLAVRVTNVHGTSKREQCRDFAGDLSNCQRFIRCFYNLRVLFTCASGTAYVPELKTCVAKELVNDCDDSKNRIDVNTNSNDTPDETDDYPTIEADFNSLEAPLQKSLFSNVNMSISSRQFGCSSFCYNQGTCILVGQSITCRCSSGFSGTRCQLRQAIPSASPFCDPNPCLNSGICTTPDQEFVVVCVCTAGYTDGLCSTPVTTTPVATANVLCTSNPCKNGATCYVQSTGGFICTCANGFVGTLCEASTTGAIIGSTTDNCGNACSNSERNSLDVLETASYDNYFYFYIQVLSYRNLCQPSPCINGGTCYLNQTSFACACRTGFTGARCQTALSAVNPCLINSCENSGTCQVISTGSYRCVCPVGYLGVRCEQRVCEPNPCLYGGVCLPYDNSFVCQCPAAYTGRCCELLVVSTRAPNPCDSQPCANGGTCSSTSATAFVCSCLASYYGRCCELRNYCQPNPCYNGGACIATVNAYLCQCIYPYSGSNCELTLATRAPQTACPCILCPCPTPITTAVNPCLPNPCQNNGGCAVVQNSPQCYCQPAFTGYYCQFTRKRSLSQTLCANITCLNGGECYVNDNGAQCTCPKPYFGKHCEIINRPRTCNPSPCGDNGQCISTKDGYKCICKNGITGVLCEQVIMPENHRWCPLDCRAGTNCVFEGSTPKCRVLNAY